MIRSPHIPAILRRACFGLLTASLICATPAAHPQTTNGSSGPRVETLRELAGILGQAHAIRALCNGDGDQTWRAYMVELMAIEGASSGRRSALTSAFNGGYRIQSKRHKRCTPDLVQVESLLATQGRALSEKIAMTYID